MKFLCIGDPHFQVSNIPEIEEFISKLIPLIKEKKPDIIVVLGDLLHTHERVHTIALNKAYDFIDQLRRFTKTYVLVGNHDYIQNQQFLTENHWMNALKQWEDVIIVDRVLLMADGNRDFVFCPYVPPGRFQEALNTNSNYNPKITSCIFAHQEFFGCKMGAIISVEGDKWPLTDPFVISGHIHSKQMPQKNIYYSGSSLQHAFGESEENIIPIFDFNADGTFTVEEVDLHLKRKKIVYTDMDSIETYVPVGSDDIKLTVSGNYDEFKAFKKGNKYKQLVSEGVKIAFKIKKNRDNDEEDKEEVRVTEDSFSKILYDLSIGDNELLQLYELLINNNEVIILS